MSKPVPLTAAEVIRSCRAGRPNKHIHGMHATDIADAVERGLEDAHAAGFRAGLERAAREVAGTVNAARAWGARSDSPEWDALVGRIRSLSPTPPASAAPFQPWHLDACCVIERSRGGSYSMRWECAPGCPVPAPVSAATVEERPVYTCKCVGCGATFTSPRKFTFACDVCCTPPPRTTETEGGT